MGSDPGWRDSRSATLPPVKHTPLWTKPQFSERRDEMWKGRELLGTVFVRWRRKHGFGSSVVAGYPQFVYATSLLFYLSELRIFLSMLSSWTCLVGEEPTTLVRVDLIVLPMSFTPCLGSSRCHLILLSFCLWLVYLFLGSVMLTRESMILQACWHYYSDVCALAGKCLQVYGR